MLLRYRPYYERFRCVAAACPDSCCAEWEVVVDTETAEKYRALPGDLGTNLRKNLYFSDGQWYFSLKDGRCPMWRQDGLCRIQAEQGEALLCATCREFPRIRHEYGNFTELQIELSCPEAAKYILETPVQPWILREVPGGEASQYDAQDMETLLQTREFALKLLEERQFSVPQILALELLYGYHAQSLLDGGAETNFVPEEALAFARQLARPTEPKLLQEFYLGLNILTERWENILREPQPADSWDERLLALARYGIERYWLQAISDFDLAGRVKMIVASCLLVHSLGTDTLSLAQLYAKEVENDTDNLDAVLDGAYTAPALTDDRLLGQLLLSE